MNPIDLRGLSLADRGLLICLAVAKLAGWRAVKNEGLCGGWIAYSPDDERAQDIRGTADLAIVTSCPVYVESVDAVLPLLKKRGNVCMILDSSSWTVEITEERGSVENDDYDVVTIGAEDAPSLAEAACIALLRAEGIEVLS